MKIKKLDNTQNELIEKLDSKNKVFDENGKSVHLFLPEPHTPILSQPGHAFSQGQTARGHLRSSASTVTQERRTAQDIFAPFYA